MATSLSHEDTKAQRGTKDSVVTEVFVFLRVSVSLWHLSTLTGPSLPLVCPPQLFL
jgi:hypothetical protein